MTLRERFEELGVPCPTDLPRDLFEVVDRGLKQGRVLCITRRKIPDEDGKLNISQAEWAFLEPKDSLYD